MLKSFKLIKSMGFSLDLAVNFQKYIFFGMIGTQLFQPLCELWSCYNGKCFSSHRFGFGSSGKLKFGLNNTHMI